MGDLTGKRIDLTFDGLIKTNDEEPINGTLKTLQDGVGNDLPVQVSNAGINFTGTVTGDNNSQYTLTSAQSGTDVNLEFEEVGGSTTDILLVAGTNVTLTDNGSNEITIDTTGGSGTSGTSGSSGVTISPINGYYGAFYENTDQPIIAPNVDQLITLTNTEISNGISLSSNQVVIANPGTYQLNAVFQITNNNNSPVDVEFWLNFNGSAYPNSAHHITLQPFKNSGNPSSTSLTFSFIGESTAPNDYIELYWTSDTANVSLNHVPPSGNVPDAGSVYVNIGQVSNLQPSTSGTSGSSGTSGNGGITTFNINYTTLTGPATNTALGCVLIPANTFSANDVLQLTGGLNILSPGGTSTFEVWINPTCDYNLAGYNIVNTDIVGQDFYVIDKKLFVQPTYTIHGESGSVTNSYADASPLDNNTATSNKYSLSPYTTKHTIDWSLDQYLVMAVQLFDNSSIIELENLHIGKINS